MTNESIESETVELTSESQVTHVYHHSVPSEPKINIKLEKNSRGWNFEVTVTGAASVDDAMGLIMEAEGKLTLAYGPKIEDKKTE